MSVIILFVAFVIAFSGKWKTTLVFVLALSDGLFLKVFWLFWLVAVWAVASVDANASSKKTLKQVAELRETRVRNAVMGFECSQACGHPRVLS